MDNTNIKLFINFMDTQHSGLPYNTLLRGVPWKAAFAIKWRSHSQTRPEAVRPSGVPEGHVTTSTTCYVSSSLCFVRSYPSEKIVKVTIAKSIAPM
jgi:hypothetical protein